MPILDLFKLDDRVALVTGASSGIGQHAAVALAEAGAHVVIVARRAGRLAETEELIQAAGGRCLAVTGDVTEPETASRAIEGAIESFGRLDILLNNAGIGTAVPATRETPLEFRRVQDVNVNGAYLMAQACSRVMGHGSSIINVASILAFKHMGLPQAAYVSSKAALVGLTRDLAAQWTREKGIRVNAIAPGFFASEMTDQYSDGYLEKAISQVPAGRKGKPEEFAAAVVFLASDAAGYVSGATLPVDGGTLTWTADQAIGSRLLASPSDDNTPASQVRRH